jgi:hypothetical protein
MVSPATAGFSGVTTAPATLAQQSSLPVADRMTEEPSGAVAVYGMPLPAGPGTFAFKPMRVKLAPAE